jgi:hypothetical protein
VYDMYPWGDPADAASAEPRNSEPRNSEPRNVPAPRRVPADESADQSVAADESVAAIRAVQAALDRRDNGGDAVAGASQPGPSRPAASRTRQ